MLAAINPVALPALRIAATFFLLINLAGGTYFFFNCLVCSTEIRMWTTSVRQRSLHKRGTLFQARTPLTLVLSPRIRVRDEKS